ncbi:MAG: NAD+ synthase [Alphaproteobacteria bacterium]
MSRADRTLNIAIGQLNPIVGDVVGNLEIARLARRGSVGAAADLLVLTELFISGYPPEDLVLRPAFVDACRDSINRLARDTADGGPAVLIGSPWVERDRLYNSVLLLDQGSITAIRHKVELPNYGVFDEMRVFEPGPSPEPVLFRDIRIGLPICEDLWSGRFCTDLGLAEPDLCISIHGSPYWRGKAARRLEIARAAAAAASCPIIYANMVGGQDELVFDGGSFGVDADGSLAFQIKWFGEAVESVCVGVKEGGHCSLSGATASEPADLLEHDWQACARGLRDYTLKNGFEKVLIGLSGGVDSAVTAAIAVDALGAQSVRCVMLPFRFTSEASITDAADCAKALGVRYETIPIGGSVEALEKALAPLFSDSSRDVTEENLQARIRGVILMAISNKFGGLLLTTGNKSEMSVGYATLYGDMNGGFNPIKDLFKSEVYRLAAWRNSNRPEGLRGPPGEVIPQSILTKAPTAELREGQTDQDSLPSYELLDAILDDLIEHERSVDEIAARGHDRELVGRLALLVTRAEYKRRQAPPGVKITRKNFGRGRRYPITNRFVES